MVGMLSSAAVFLLLCFNTIAAVTTKTKTCNKESQSLSTVYDIITNADFISPLDALSADVFVSPKSEEDETHAAVNSRLAFFSGNGMFSRSSDAQNDKDFERRIAECTLTHVEKSGPVVQILYLPLKDAEAYAKRVESLVDGTTKIKFANAEDEEDDSNFKRNVQFKCKTITMDDETKKCSTCVYAEVLVSKKHVRYGHFGSASILECINGYDNNLKASSERPYFVQSTVNYHPICIA